MKKEKGSDRISTFIGADASIDGNIQFKGTIRVDGAVKGKISSKSGTVVVGEKAVVNAEVFVNVAVIMGELNGTIFASQPFTIRYGPTYSASICHTLPATAHQMRTPIMTSTPTEDQRTLRFHRSGKRAWLNGREGQK